MPREVGSSSRIRAGDHERLSGPLRQLLIVMEDEADLRESWCVLAVGK